MLIWLLPHKYTIIKVKPLKLTFTIFQRITVITATGSTKLIISLQWHHNERRGISNNQHFDSNAENASIWWRHHVHYTDVIMATIASQINSLNRLFRRRSKKISKLRVTGLCVGNSPEISEIPAQMASNAENVSIWWRHHVHAEKSEGFKMICVDVQVVNFIWHINRRAKYPINTHGR